MEHIDRMRANVDLRDPGITHDRDAGAGFFILSEHFRYRQLSVRKCMIRAELMPDLMNNIIDIEIITLWNTIVGRCDTGSFGKRIIVGRVYTNTTNTACISTTTRGAKHVANIIIRTSYYGS